MTILRRHLDPLRSRWYANKIQRPSTNQVPMRHKKITLHIAFDDPYSYLVMQIIAELLDLLHSDCTLTIVIHIYNDTNVTHHTTHQIQLCEDARALAEQYGFVFDSNCHFPSPSMLQQVHTLFQHHNKHAHNLKLLTSIFHMLWQHQQHKLDMLVQRLNIPSPTNATTNTTSQAKLIYKIENHLPQQLHIKQRLAKRLDNITGFESSFFEYAGQKYRAIDDLVRFSRKLKRLKLLTREPVFLSDHVEWGEHLVSDPQVLSAIQTAKPHLDIYGALEDPFTWLIVQYFNEYMAGYYNLKLHFHPISYRHLDQFDWQMAFRLSKRCRVPFAPFCRPDAEAVSCMAAQLYAYPPDKRITPLLTMLHGVWCKGLDYKHPKHQLPIDDARTTALPNTTTTNNWLSENTAQAAQYGTGAMPLMVLHVGDQHIAFHGLYRVWRVEAILAKYIEH